VPPVILGLWWRRGNGAAVLTSFASGLGLLLGWPLLPGLELVREVFPTVALSTAAFVGIFFATEDAAHARVTALLRAAPAD
jgi:Na+/proline symporter